MLPDQFESFKPQLRSFIFRMLANRENTEDLLHDTYIKASENFNSFRNESSLKTWVFAIAANLCRDFLKSKRRWVENVTDLSKEAMNTPDGIRQILSVHQNSPHGAFEIKEHINYCFTCLSKTLETDHQLALVLKEMYQFKTEEIATIMNRTEPAVKHLLHDARATMTGIFERRCALIGKQGVCHQCSELNGIFNPQQNTQEELLKLKMVKESDMQTKEKLLELRMALVSSVESLECNGTDLQLFHFRHTERVVEAHLDRQS